MDNTKMVKIGLVGAAVSAAGLFVSAVVAECRRHKAKKELLNTQIELGFTKIDNCLKNAAIRELENKIQDLKSNCKEKES